jgi:ribosome-associated translation inhibitor RaiA
MSSPRQLARIVRVEAKMQIQIHTDHNIEGREALSLHVTGVVESALGRFKDRLTRVEVHLSDQNSGKGGEDDKRCMIEARLAGRPPSVVTHQAATLDQAIDGAVHRLKSTLDSSVERLQDHHR